MSQPGSLIARLYDEYGIAPAQAQRQIDAMIKIGLTPQMFAMSSQHVLVSDPGGTAMTDESNVHEAYQAALGAASS